MTSRIRRFAAAFATLLASFAIATPASASTTYSTDYTDLWYTSTESGWGVNIIQQGQVIFVSLFVFDGASLPRWYFASSVTPSSPTNWSGTFYRTQGTSFAAPWNPAQAGPPTPVGTITLNFTSPTTGTMAYSVDGIQVTKAITRISFAPDTLTGTYLGGLLANVAQCSSNTPGGYFIADRLVVDHSNQSLPRFTVDFFVNGNTATECVFQGAYTQQGRMGTIQSGAWSCSGGANNAGTFTMTEIQATQNGLSAKFSGKDQFCSSITGYFGGVKDVL